MLDVREALALVKEHEKLDPSQRIAVVLTRSVEPTGEGEDRSEVAYASTMARTDAANLFLFMVRGWLPVRGEAERYGNELRQIGDMAHHFAIMDALDAMVKLVARRFEVPEAAVESVMLTFAIHSAHERLVPKEEVLGACIDSLEEEYSTPNTAGRLALRNLVGGMGAKPEGGG